MYDIRLQILDSLHLVMAFLWVASSPGQSQHQSLIKRRFYQANQTGKLQQQGINEYCALSQQSLINHGRVHLPLI